MNELKLFDPTGYMVKGKLRLKNLTLEDYKITEIQSKKVECRMAVFHNVFFQNDLEDTFIEVKNVHLQTVFLVMHLGITVIW